MWNKIAAWHRALEAEQMAILKEPALADTLPPGYRRKMGIKLAQLSPIERQQMRGFLLKYEGRRGYLALAKIVLLLTTIGVVLHVVAPKNGLGEMIMLTNVGGLGLLAATLAAWFNYRSAMRRQMRKVFGLFAMVGLGTVVGVALRSYQRGIPLASTINERWAQLLLGVCVGGLMVATPLVIVTAVRNRQHRSLSARLELDAERERAARELSESRLRLLHAQIEPHFLFNTLGAVQQLAESHPPKAAALTAHLIDFLRASLAQMRSETETLNNDFALVESYLQVMTARLGVRLRYSMDLPEQLRQTPMPSMMLLTLVENAIKHGIEPSLRGGSIHVSAAQAGGSVRICVRDTGVGLAATPGAGDGLDNVRKRLQLIYPGASSLTVEDAPDGGVLATIIIPANPEKAFS